MRKGRPLLRAEQRTTWLFDRRIGQRGVAFLMGSTTSSRAGLPDCIIRLICASVITIGIAPATFGQTADEIPLSLVLRRQINTDSKDLNGAEVSRTTATDG